MVEIFFRDLTPEKQQEIIEALGDNGNYDVFPIACIPTESEEDADWISDLQQGAPLGIWPGGAPFLMIVAK